MDTGERRHPWVIRLRTARPSSRTHEILTDKGQSPVSLMLIGEVFNLFNTANLSGRSGNLLSSGFGQAKSRVTQVFGSGGPRAFQFAARLSF